jgi:hypothetical protein
VCETNNNFQFLINNQEVIELTYDYAKYTNDLKLKNTNNNFVDKTLNDTNGFIPLANYRIKDVKSSDSKISYNTSTGKITIDPKLDANTYKLEFD